ncbi:CD63 antigen-like [Culicoides brevitarsis]|uniref:CD63 antigen-like n=1 Tax=Culicoides brevitarsis TaxID=469753 RepID=UPI00307B6635
MGSCTTACAKYLVFFFNLLFALTGLIVFTVGTIILVRYYHYYNFVGQQLWTAPLFLIVVGAVVFVIAFFGCCSAIKESSCMILTFSILLVLIFLTEIGVGIAGYIKHSELDGILGEQFNTTLKEYMTDPDAQQSWNSIQKEFNCCGIMQPDDWKPIFKNDTVPNSCCNKASVLIPPEKPRNTTCTQEYAAKMGCRAKLYEFLDNSALILGAVGLSIAVVQLLGVCLACCLSRAFKENYEAV